MGLNFKIKKQVSLFLVFISLLISSKIVAQGTTCAGATSITTNGACTSSVTITDATINGNATVCGATVNREAWYIFTATGTTATIVATANNRNVAIELLSACGGTVVGCDNTTTTNGTDTETLTVSGLTNGTNYIVRIVNVSTTSNNIDLTTLCITGPVSAPSNDDPTGAIAITPAATCSYTTFTNAAATSSTCGTIPAPGCASYSGSDVWFSVTVPASGGFILDSQTGVITDGGMAVYSGSACGTMTLLACDDDSSPNGSMPSLTVTATAGSTVFIRFWEFGNDNNGTFGICATTYTPPVAPANDNCAGAYTVAVNSGQTCTSQTGGTVVGATASGIAMGSCFGTADDDVWYSFVATNTTHTVNINNVAGSVTDMYHSVYSGSCGSLSAALVCSDPNTSALSGLTIGNTYYVRVYTYTGTSGQTSTFSVCVTSPPPPPANDECAGAYTVAVNSSSTACTSQTGGTLVGATASSYTNACGGTADDDVWYSFVATSTSHSITLNSLAGSTTDLYISVYGGSCGSPGSPLVCSDPQSTSVGGLTVGNTYFIRIFSYTSTSGQTSTFSVCVNTPPPPPSNDNPCTATPAAVNSGTTCTVQTGGTVLGATSSTVGLGSCFGTPDDDVWYSFVATNAIQNFSLTNVAGSVTDMYFSVHPGTCGAIGTAFICSDPNNGTVTGLIVGQTYYVRVYTYTSTGNQNTTFSLCITPPPPPPTNDDCATPTTITVNGGTTCTSQANGTLLGATASSYTNACSGTADDDVWYSFVATSTTHSISITNVAGSPTDLYHSLYSGTCGSLGAPIICSDPNSSDISGLTIGATYFIRVFSYTSGTGSTTTFSVCVTTPPAGPANDNPCSPTVVTVNTGTTCTSQSGGTLVNAYPSVVPNTCGGTADDDVWYSFVASANTHSISLNNIAGSTTDLYHSVFTGTCNNLGTALICSDPNTSIITGLTIGSTYYIRVFSWTSTSGQTSTFSVCVTTPTVPPAPANDNCTGAYPVTINSGTVCTSLTGGTLYGATASTQTNSCGNNYTDDDVWYSFVATDTYHQITLNNVAGSTTDLYHSVYSGTCGTLGTAITCSDPNTSAVNGLIIGNTYYVRVYSVGTTYGATTTFSICITTPPDPPANTLCSGMTPICSGSAINFTAESNGASAPGGNNYGCLSTYPNPTWYYMEILTSGTMAVDLTAGSDVDFALWGPYANLSAAQAACGSYPSPLDCSYSTSATEQMNIPLAVTGEVYAVLVTNYANVVQSITLNQASGASATTNCAIVLPIGLLYFTGNVDEFNNVYLQWATETETNNDYFEIQKLVNESWVTIATKDGMGNSSTKTYYNYTDKNPRDGLSYYRLKQVNFDQTFNYSNAISVDLSKDREQITNIRPNPTNELVYYDYISKSKADITIEVVSFTGESLFKETKNVETGFNSFNVSLQEFENGVYLLKITNDNSGKIFSQKIIKN